MKRNFQFLLSVFLLLIVSFLSFACSNKRSGPPKVLVFSRTEGFHHASIAEGIKAIQQLGKENGFKVDATTNANKFTEKNLKQYSAVIFLSTTGDVLNKYQEANFERYIEAGGGYVGIHAASDTEFEWGWYGRLVGAYFHDHPKVQKAKIMVVDSTHQSTSFLPNPWIHTDEWYNFNNYNEDVHVLLALDEDSYKGGTHTGKHPIAWYHKYDGGRAFYTGLGHTKASYSDSLFLKHLLGGIQYAIGKNRVLSYSQIETEQVPEDNRFSLKYLAKGAFTEPTEMTILPNRDVLVAQRRGEILLYDHSDSSLTAAAMLDVYYDTGNPNVNSEAGLLGIKASPNFEENHYVFVFYSPADTSVNRLSRFVLKDNKLSMESEDIILQFRVRRGICCHTGGSIAFDGKGLLYLSTGDNTTPFDQSNTKYPTKGYAPLDERDGYKHYNALRTAANTNDLRGKILRIRVNEDGSYDIPEGNLFPKGKEKTRPEIYVMGLRNPYRISVDKKTGYLYWGNVGPDADKDRLKTRGPRGYDEIGQAREPGFYGWPMFIGANYAYHRYNYNTGETGSTFNPDHPINDSRYNDGLKKLPPAQKPFIWYPYAPSEQFPKVGSGGRTAMAGPVYYTDMYPKDSRLPAYFNGKLFIYEFMRGWIKVVSMWPNGDFSKMSSFMPETDFDGLIDMEVGPEGRIYLLEYGNGWFTKNEESGLSYIVYNSGNRSPVVKDLSVNKRSGVLPLQVKAKVTATDPEDDALTYTWDLGNGTVKETTEPHIEYTFEKAGLYSISVKVSDGEFTRASNPVSVYAGNAAPRVNIEITGQGNRTFYFPNTPVQYQVQVSDKDGEVPEKLTPPALFVTADYVQGGTGQGTPTAVSGKILIESLDCRVCHDINGKSVGPSLMKVAKRYQDSSGVVATLSNKIIEGGSGVWGQVAMPAHPQLSKAKAHRIVKWILSLNESNGQQQSLAAKGSLDPTLGKELLNDGVLVITASYTDEGGTTDKSLTGTGHIRLRNNTMSLKYARELTNYTSMQYQNKTLLTVPSQKGSFSLGAIDIRGVEAVELQAAVLKAGDSEYVFEVRMGSPNGKVAGKTEVDLNHHSSNKQYASQQITIPLDQPIEAGQIRNLYIVSHPVNPDQAGSVMLVSVQFIAE